MLDLEVTHVVGGDKYHLRLPVVVHLFQNLHGGGTAAACFRVPEEQTLRTDVPVNETTNGGAECLLLIGT